MQRLELPKQVILVDRSSELVAAWNEVFDGFDGVSARQGDYFSFDADCMLSPANSFGIMDGGLDLAIRDRLGFAVESAVQAEILKTYHGECPVGSAFVVDTKNDNWPHLVIAPTMRVPEPLPNSINAYLAF